MASEVMRMSRVIELSRRFPALPLQCRARRDLLILGAEPGRYMGMALIISSLAALLVCLVSWVLGLGQALLQGALAFASCMGFFLILPGIEMKRRSAEIEAQMPLFLRSVGLLLEMRLPFHRAIELASEGEGVLQHEMRAVMREVRRGMSLQSAFSALATGTCSLTVKRAVSQLVSAYEVGGGEMRRIGDEMLAMEQHRLKQYSARSTMFGLLFIISSAIMPTFFLVYAIAGRFALGGQVEEPQMAMALLVVFPLTSVLIMLLSKSTMPRTALSRPSGFDARLLAPGLLFIAGFLIVPQLQLLTFIAGIAAGGYFILASHREEKRMEEIEARLPDALFSIGGLPKSSSPQRIFELIRDNGHGALSEEAGKSRRQLEMNLGIDAVLDDLWQRNRSGMLRRACGMMRQMFHTDSLDKLNMLAEDIIANFQIMRERSQIFAMQKYTLVFGAFLIALILRMTLHLLDGMGGLMDDASVAGLVLFAESIVPPYLIIYSMISAAAIADAEGKKSSLAIYFLLLAALGLITFNFISL